MTARPRRVLVLGNCGSGKSTLARQLGDGLGLNVVHLDALYWRPGWVEPTPAEWADAVARAAAGDAWVMDGNYAGTMDARLARAEAVVLLDLPRPLCLWRVLVRRVRYHGRHRPDMADGCPERITWEFLVWIWRYPRRSRAATLGRLAAVTDGRPVFIFRRPAQVRAFARAVARHHRLPAPVPPPRPTRRRSGVVPALLLTSIALDHRFGRGGDDWSRYDHTTRRAVAIAGDAVRLEDGTAVHLLGVADPAPAAADWLADRLADRPVTLLLPSVTTRDPGGRLVAYAFSADDDGCLNVSLVRDGMAYADRRGDDPMAGAIDAAENEARRKGLGLWKGLRFEQMPAWRRAWLAAKSATKRH